MTTMSTVPLTAMQQHVLEKFPQSDGIELPRIAAALRGDGFSITTQRVHHYVIVLWTRGYVERETGKWSGKWRRKKLFKNQPVDSSMTSETAVL